MMPMNTILVITAQDFDSDSPIVDTASFGTREAARAVLLDKHNQIYLLNVSGHSYHKLPGGGIDKDEDTVQALERELMEEIGCTAEILAELGTVIEYRDNDGLIQTSYCYLARQTGDQTESNLEESELAAGMIEFKAKNVNEAIRILTTDEPNNLEGKYIQKRDIAFLKAAKVHMEQQHV